MPGAHEPREEFLNQLELQLRKRLRRRDLIADTRRWIPQSRTAVAFATVLLVVVSMAVGGAVVAAAYQARMNELRAVLLSTFEQRLLLAQQRLALVTRQLESVQRGVEVGVERQESALDARFKVAEAEAEVKSIELDIAEIRATGREPMKTLSAPLVSGRDFVTEGLRVEMTVPARALEIERVRAQAAQSRLEVGLANTIDVAAAATRVIELESAVQVFERKLDIRQRFLKGNLTAAAADLRGLEAGTDLRRTVIARRIDFARRQVEELRARIEVGTANPLTLAEAELRLQELQLEMSKADYELLLIRKQLGK
jgi:outer membrane protein TolC